MFAISSETANPNVPIFLKIIFFRVQKAKKYPESANRSPGNRINANDTCDNPPYIDIHSSLISIIAEITGSTTIDLEEEGSNLGR